MHNKSGYHTLGLSAMGWVGLAIVVVIVIIVSGVGAAAIYTNSVTPKTSEPVQTSTSSVNSSTLLIFPGFSSTTSEQYNVTFVQIGACPPNTFWGIPWSVTINGVTRVQPPNTTLPINNFTLYGTQDQSLTRITFFLSAGEYIFSVSPSDNFFTPTNGTVSVNGNTTVPIDYSGTSCTVATYQSTPNVTTATSTNSNQTCTPAVTITQNNATQVLVLCHTKS